VCPPLPPPRLVPSSVTASLNSDRRSNFFLDLSFTQGPFPDCRCFRYTRTRPVDCSFALKAVPLLSFLLFQAPPLAPSRSSVSSFFDLELKDASIACCRALFGLPTSPSLFSPVASPDCLQRPTPLQKRFFQNPHPPVPVLVPLWVTLRLPSFPLNGLCTFLIALPTRSFSSRPSVGDVLLLVIFPVLYPPNYLSFPSPMETLVLI